jgi:MoaA/NifB/PqqE/SkfB family radical SAM enzyme
MISAKWDITNRCNLRCGHCSVAAAYFSDCANNAGGTCRELSLEDKITVLNHLAEGGVTHVSLLGGEPMMLGRQLTALIIEAKRLGMTVGVVSNGTLLDEAACHELVDAGLDRITVSIESSRAEQHDRIRGKGNFARVVANVRRLVAAKKDGARPSLSINTVLSRINRDGFVDMVPFSRSLGAQEWTALTLNHLGSAEKNLSDLLVAPAVHTAIAVELAQRFPEYCGGSSEFRINIQLIYPLVWEQLVKGGIRAPWPQICCGAARSLVFLAPDGGMHLCDRVHGTMYSNGRINGEPIQPADLTHSSFSGIWTSRQYAEMFQFVRAPGTYDNYSPCRRCKYLSAGLCEPCPLYALEGKEITFTQCLAAENELGDISGPVDWSGIPACEERGRFEEVLNVAGVARAEGFGSTGRPSQAAGIRHYHGADGDGLIYNPRTAQSLKLNPLAHVIWDSADGRRTAGDIVGGTRDFYSAAWEALAKRTAGEPQMNALTARAGNILAEMKTRGFLVER